MSKLFDLLAQRMDQGPNRRLALFKGHMDVLIGRGSKVHRMEHNPNNPCCATIAKPEQSQAFYQSLTRGVCLRPFHKAHDPAPIGTTGADPCLEVPSA